jgi:hypothetical protein
MVTGKCERLHFNWKFDEEYFLVFRRTGGVRSALCYSYCKATLEGVKMHENEDGNAMYNGRSGLYAERGALLHRIVILIMTLGKDLHLDEF